MFFTFEHIMRWFIFKGLWLAWVFPAALPAQPVTGVWRGKVVRGQPPLSLSYKLEVKLVKQGDSLTGTSYYFANSNNYARFSVRGYLDPVDASIHWWDETLLEKKGGGFTVGSVNNQPLAMQTDFSCPGAGIMKLDGVAETKSGTEMEVHLDKTDEPVFSDDWIPLIQNWFYGGADPDAVARVSREQMQPRNQPVQPAVASAPPPKKSEPPAPVRTETVRQPAPPPAAPVPKPPSLSVPVVVSPPPPLSNTARFETRERVVQTTLPLAGDTVEIQFYDNAEVDGDSIALFLNGRLLMEHIKLSSQPFVLRLAVASLTHPSELVMVAENLGAIPPNTAFMLALINGQRYSARLESTEKTSAVIRLQ